MRGALAIVFLLLSVAASAQGRRSRVAEEPPKLSWDLGAAFGSYDGYSYSEIDAGLNYRFYRPFNWRNVAWDRIASAPVGALGLDSSIRYEVGDSPRQGDFGFRVFIGPGVRISSAQYTGAFAEGGAIFRMGGLNLGAGVKIINYNSPGKDPSTGLALPNQDTIIFIIIAGGGAL